MPSKQGAILASIATGVALELGVAAVGGRREAWDSEIFLTVGLPAVLLISCAIGYFAGRKHWFWTALIVPSQVTTMMVRNGEISGLWPLMVVLSSILGLPFLVAAFVASRFRPKEL